MYILKSAWFACPMIQFVAPLRHARMRSAFVDG